MANGKRKGLKVGVQFHKASGQFSKIIGKALGRDGLPRPKLFYLGSDEAGPVIQASQLKARWKALQLDGKTVWDEEPSYQSERGTGQATPVERQGVVTVGNAAKMYLDQLEQQYRGGQFGESHFISQRYRLMKAIAPLSQLPLSMVGEKQLQSAVLQLAQRPPCELRRPKTSKVKQPKKTRRMSPTYAKASIATLKWFFQWCDESDLWNRPKRFARLFKVRPILNADEQHKQLTGESEVDFFTLDELRALWSKANDHQRLLIALGLNCAFANAEIASLRVCEVKDLATPAARIERFRTKTIKTAGRASFARWSLWTETSDLLNQHRAPNNEQGLYLLTDAGLRLDANNSIGQSWLRLVHSAGVRRLTFKYLRKTAANLVRNELGFGSETADMILSHADSGIIKHYAGRDWNRLKAATDAMRVYLAPMFATLPVVASQTLVAA